MISAGCPSTIKDAARWAARVVFPDAVGPIMVIIFCFIGCFFVRKKKCMSAFGWCTVFEFLSAKVIKISEKCRAEGKEFYQKG